MTLRPLGLGTGEPTTRQPHDWGPEHLTGRVWHSASVQHVVVLVLADLTIAVLATWAVIRELYAPTETFALAVVVALGLVVTTAACQGYRIAGFAVGLPELRSILRATGALACLVLLAHETSWLTVPLDHFVRVLVLTVALALAVRVVLWAWARRRRADGRQFRRTLLVGPADSLEPVFAAFDEDRAHGLTVVGLCSPKPGKNAEGTPVLGDYEAISDLVRQLQVEAVAVSADAMGHEDLRRLGWSLRGTRAELILIQPLIDMAARRLRLEPMAGTPLLSISFESPTWRRFVKATFDRTVGSLLLLMAAPIILGAGAIVRLTSRGPAFFTQTRVGIDGVPFPMYKLRSMYEDAEERLAELQEHHDGNGMLFKLRQDPRVTPVGRFLRRYSIDELPQLWNVVRGDMSLVGPRPALPREVAAYDHDVAQRLHVRPGLTGLWQVSGRSNLSAERSVRLDLRYADNWTVLMDLRILYRTARAVLGGDGAY